MGSHSTDNISEYVTFMVTSVAKRHSIKESWTASESLVDGGLTSVAMVELMLEVERAFDLTLPDSELNVANFFSIATLAVLLDRLTEPQGERTLSFRERETEQKLLASSLPLT